MLLRQFIAAICVALLVAGCTLIDEHLFPSLTGEKPAPTPLVEKEPTPGSSRLAQATNALGQLAISRPLAVIRFDRPDVAYQGPLYKAVSQALERRPSTIFELVAVSPDQGTPAQAALLASDARRNAERVMRELKSMGLSASRMSLSTTTSANASTTEVHLYVR